MGKVILVSSGKGGTGKTMFSVNMGATLAMQGKRVLLMDMDMGLRNLDLYLGMENRVIFNIMDVLSGVCRISKAMIKVNGFDSLYFMAASPKRDDRDLTPLHMRILCEKLTRNFDYVIIDCPAGLSNLADACIAPAQKAVIVTEPEVASLRDADVTERYIIEHDVTDTCVVINKLNVDLMNTGLVPSLDTMKHTFQGPIVGIIQNDDNIHISTNSGTPIVCKKGTYIQKNFEGIVARITG